ncbi:hypothetical protein [Mesorhizobium sp. CA6]|nr:hypothetical protein [Mesorhizobium sp. CA6]
MGQIPAVIAPANFALRLGRGAIASVPEDLADKFGRQTCMDMACL